MSKKASPAAIGGFVLGAIALLVAGILVFSSGTLFREKSFFVSYFPGTVQGLNVGAPVQFQGVQIGIVTDVRLDYYQREARFSIPVRYEIWRDAFRTHGPAAAEKVDDESRRANVRTLVEKQGLRAVLSSVSLVTGQYVVSLELRPDSSFKYVGEDPTLVEIPTVEATRDKLSDMLQSLNLSDLVKKATSALDGISALVNDPATRAVPGNIDKALADARKLVDDLDSHVQAFVDRVDATLADYEALAKTASARIGTLADSIEDTSAKVGRLSGEVGAKVDPITRSVTGAFDSAHKTFNAADDMISPESATRTNLDTMLQEAAGAARSLRILADYLEQNPDALIKGKY